MPAAAPRGPRNRRLGAISAGLVLLALGLPLLLGWRYAELDLGRLDVGSLCALEAQRQAGHGVWLSSFMGLGAPLLSWHYGGFFYPPRWLTWLFDPDLGASLGGVLHLMLAAAGATWLGRSFRLRADTSIFVGLIFAFAGTQLDLLSKAEFKAGAAFLPFVWAGVRGALRRRESGSELLVAALAAAMLLLGGEPQAFGVAVVIVVVELGLHAGRATAERLVATGLALGGALAVGLVLWLPVLAEASLTQRSSALSPDEVFAWSFGAEGALSALWPGAFTRLADPGIGVHQWLASDVRAHVPWNLRAYVGLVPLALALVALRSPRARAPLLLAALGLVAALGDNTPVMPLLAKVITPLARFRYPAKYLVVTSLSLAVLAGLGLEQLRQRRERARPVFLLLGLGLLLTGGAFATFWVGAEGIDASVRALAGGGSAFPSMSSVLRTTALHAALAPALVLLLLWRRGPAGVGSVALVVVLDLLCAAPLHVEVTEAGPLVDPPLEDLRASPGAPPHLVPVLCADQSLSALQVVDEHGERIDGLDPRRRFGLAEYQACQGMTSAVSYSSPLVTRTARALVTGFRRGNANAARALGCTHVTAVRPLVGDVLRPVSGRDDGGDAGEPRVYEVRDPVPPVFLLKRPAWTNERDLVDHVAQADRASSVLRYVDDPAGRVDGRPPLPAGERATLEGFTWVVRDEVEIQLAGQGGAVLGLRSEFWLGWRAFQAERELPVVRAGYRMVAAVVDDVSAGPVTLRYRPPRLGGALFAFFFGLGLWALAWVVARRSPRMAPALRQQ